MGIHVTEDRLLSFAEAAAKLPGKPNCSTIWRWATKGVRGVRLEWVSIGRRRFTSLEALQRFTERCTAATPTPGDAPRVSSPARRKAIEAAERRLRAAGV